METNLDKTNKDIKEFNLALRGKLLSIAKTSENSFSSGFNINLIEELLMKKPISEKELLELEFVNDVFIKKYKTKVLEIFSSMIKKFEEKYPFMERINFETRKVMEMVNYRNVRLSEENRLISKPKFSDKEIVFSELKLEMNFERIFISVFKKESKIKFNFNIEQLKEQISKIVNYQNTSISNQKINNLYITFGNMEGSISSKTKKIKINSPLLFLPVKLIENDQEIFLSYDPSREFSINNDVILMKNNIFKNNTKINPSYFNEIKSSSNFNMEFVYKALIKYYTKNGFIVSNEKLNNNVEIKPEFTIGIYDIYKNSTQIDLENILENGFVTKNILDLFTLSDSTVRLDELSGKVNEVVENRKNELIKNNEYESSFVTKINFPQDKAIKGIKVNDNIVIQGPPGTGKTETIVSIISDSILRNKKILVSSEKIVALDVIKSRMAELAKYALIFTNVNDSASFYDQLNFMISESIKDKSNQANTSLIMSDNEILFRRQETRKQIIDFMKDYQSIFQYLKSNEIGKTYSYLYKFHGAHRTNEKEIIKILNKSSLIEIIKQNNLFVPRLYDILYMLNQKFSYKNSNSEFDIDRAVLSKYPFLITHTRKNLTFSKIDKTLSKLKASSDEELFFGNEFSSKTMKILKSVFIDVKHLKTYAKNKNDLINFVELLNKKMKQITNSTNQNSPEEIYNSLGAAWMHLFEEISKVFKKNNKKIEHDLISNVIFDHTIQKILELKESSSSELQKNISNGNINTFNQMISKSLSEIVDFNITLTGRKLRDKLLDVLIKSGKLSEIQSITENQKSLNVNKFMEKHWTEIFESVNVWLLPATSVSNFFPLEPQMFDIVIIDEASQMLVEKAIPLMYRAKQLVISGDDKQLKPSVNKEKRIFIDEQELKIKNVLVPPFGLQDALKNKFPNFLLNYHYRSRYTELIAFSNSFIYNKSLYVSTPKVYDKSNPPIVWHKIDGAKMVGGKNLKEANEVVKKTIELIQNNPDSTIGIIAFTFEQKELIQERLNEMAKKNDELDLFIRTNSFTGEGEDTSLFVKNVSEVQGDERDNIVFSIGFAKQSNGEYPSDLGEISKENGENRLNVAITRAKEKIVVVSSVEPNDMNFPTEDIGGQLLKHFLYYAQSIKSGNKRNIRRILKLEDVPETKVFESPMHEEIFNLIKDSGYIVEYKYGFDDYKLDFVIKNEIGNIIVAINLDNEQYLRNFNTMEREYYLPTYLEARGWNIIRVWSHQWAKDPENENQRILERIKEAIETFENGTVISLYGKGKKILDLNGEDELYDNEDEIDGEKIINESAKILEERYDEILRVERKILSQKRQAEEQKWLEEYEAIESRGATIQNDIDLILDRDFNLNPKNKSMDGIEDQELQELIHFKNKRGKK